MTTLRALTHTGRRAAAEMLARVRSGELATVDMTALADTALSSESGVAFDDPSIEHVETRWHLSRWLFECFAGHHDAMTAGSWSWLSLHLFDVLCPLKQGARKVREDARYLLEEGDYRKAHRHLLAGPYLLMLAHRADPESVRGLLATAPDAPGEVYEQLAARKYTVTSPAVVRVATRLYLEPTTGRLRRGAGGAGGGSARRLGEVLQQFDVTYDLQQIGAERLAALLPAEFGKFLK
jgi:hypothetical protein